MVAIVNRPAQENKPPRHVRSYVSSCERYQKKSHNDAIVVLCGYGASLRVERDALILTQGFTNVGSKVTYTYYRGTHKLHHIVILAESGNVSLAAMRWCAEQEIAISVIDSQGHVTNSMTGEEKSSAQLRRAQYCLNVQQKGKIAAEIVRRKIEGQLDTLRRHPELPGKQFIPELEASLKWFYLRELPPWLTDIDTLRTFEGRVASLYFDAWLGHPLTWNKHDSTKVPPHWLKITGRTSAVNGHKSARYAICPLHAALNLAYAVCESSIRGKLHTYGFDTACGILHADKERRDSLVYDVLELFRGMIDDLVLSLFGKLTLTRGDIIQSPDGSIKLNPQLARFVIEKTCVEEKDIEVKVVWLKEVLVGLD